MWTYYGYEFSISTLGEAPVVDADSVLAQPVPDPYAEMHVLIHKRFSEFYEAQYRPLLWQAMAMLNTRAEAEDVVQQVFAEMYPLWPTIESPLAYARKAITSNVIKYRRKSARFTTLDEVEYSDDRVATDDRAYNAVLNRLLLDELLQHLNPVQRAVIEAGLVGRTTEEIAIALGKNPDAVRKIRQRATVLMKAVMLEQREDGGTERGPGDRRDHEL